jgi:hypothetical protein
MRQQPPHNALMTMESHAPKTPESKFGTERLCNSLNQLLLRLPPPAVDDSVNAGDACWLNSLAFLIPSSKRSIARFDRYPAVRETMLRARVRSYFADAAAAHLLNAHGGSVFNCKRVQPFVPCARCSAPPKALGEWIINRARARSLAHPVFRSAAIFHPAPAAIVRRFFEKCLQLNSCRMCRIICGTAPSERFERERQKEKQREKTGRESEKRQPRREILPVSENRF